MVLFIEACESGSMFEGLLNAELPIYVTTAANAHESSWGTYCPGMAPSPPPEFTTCLGDLYSVAWLEEVYVQGVCVLIVVVHAVSCAANAQRCHVQRKHPPARCCFWLS